jgi:hypothetical protein
MECCLYEASGKPRRDGPVVLPEGAAAELHAGGGLFHGSTAGTSEHGSSYQYVYSVRNTSITLTGPLQAADVLERITRHVALEAGRICTLRNAIGEAIDEAIDDKEDEDEPAPLPAWVERYMCRRGMEVKIDDGAPGRACSGRPERGAAAGDSRI